MRVTPPMTNGLVNFRGIISTPCVDASTVAVDPGSRLRHGWAFTRRHHRDRRRPLTMEIMGFIGLGKMGGNMAARYLAAGHAVYGEARDPNGSQWRIEKGLRWVDTPRQVADAVDIVMTSLPNDDVVGSVAESATGSPM